MIERLLAAERALDAGQLDLAERLYGQVAAADPRNAIAMTGQATVARRQGDLEAARRHLARALQTDPDDAAALALAAALDAERPPLELEPDQPAEPAHVAGARRSADPGSASGRSIAASMRRLLRRVLGR